MLQVRNLTVDYSGRHAGSRRAIDNVSFDLGCGEALGLLGESGCGKTTLALALLGLLPRRAQVTSGSIRFQGLEILEANERELRAIRGAAASIVFQEPALSLNPLMRAGVQIAEVVRAHSHAGRRVYRRQAESTLAEVGLLDPRIYSAYPHQLSSGQRQRVALAQALVSKPAFLIADEPTSALDNLAQADIIELLKNLRQRYRGALLFITHNPMLLAGLADRVMILRDGQVVEEGTLANVYERPSQAYTHNLLRSVPLTPGRNPVQLRKSRLPADGAIVFNKMREIDCNLACKTDSGVLLEARNLSKRFPRGRWSPRAGSQVCALDDVSLDLPCASTLALVGESGAGKSTLARCLAKLEKPDSGQIWFEGRNLLDLPPRDSFAARRRIQFVFQDSATAINARFSAADLVEEPLRIQFSMRKKERREIALSMLERVGVSSHWAERPAMEFSGGERQRLALARALVLKPRLLILDEALANLDLPMQAQIVKLLRDLQADLSLTYLFISHDFRLAASIAHRIAVMQAGRIVEVGSMSSIICNPIHAYTRLLVAAIPRLPPMVAAFRAAETMSVAANS